MKNDPTLAVDPQGGFVVAWSGNEAPYFDEFESRRRSAIGPQAGPARPKDPP